jgi:spermidine synthase
MLRRTLTLYLCFLLSGAAALVYEIVWQRMLTLVFGVSTLSVSAVVAAFLGGIALGARLNAARADRTPRPIRLYALIELGIALAGLASLFFIPPLMQAFAAIYRATEPDWLTSNLIRFGLAFVAVGVPSMLIGATMPVMTRIAARQVGSTASGFGGAYAVNVAGSVLGVIAAGFFLVRLLGVEWTLFCAVAGNVVVGLLALLIRERTARGASAAEPVTKAPPIAERPAPAPMISTGFACVAALITGLSALAYEIAWIRLLAIFTLNSVYIFAMVLSVYLTALAIGSAAVAILARWRRFDPLATLAITQLLQALIVPILLACAPAASQLNIASDERSPAGVLLIEYTLVVAVVFVPTILIGFALPLLVCLAQRSVAESGRLVGRIYAWNTVGSILGAALAGVVLIPFMGMRGTLLLLAGGNLAVVAAAMYAGGQRAGWLRGLTPAAAAAFAIALALLPGATRFYLPADVPNETILYYAEGAAATVHVAEYRDGETSHRTLFVDSKSVAGTYPDIVTDQKMLAHLPLLLHPDPQRALTVGFGTGGTSYSMLEHGVKVDCVEIEPRVAQAYDLFESENRGLVGPDHNTIHFRLILDDARAWLTVAPEKYDVIVTDLTSIQYRGNGNLYTDGAFRLMREQLNPGGLGAAWVPITGITPEALKMIVRTFQSVFPHTSVWYMINLPTDFVIIVGTEERLAIPLANIAERMQVSRVARDLAPIGMDDPYKLAAGLLLAEDDIAAYTGPGPIHRDYHPVLDYLTHASPYRNTLPENLGELVVHRRDPIAYITTWPGDEAAARDTWSRWYAASEHLINGHIALRSYYSGHFADARAKYEAALELIPDDRQTRNLLAEMTDPARP